MDKVDPLVVIASLAASAVTALLFFTQKPAPPKPLVNPGIKKDQPKVVDSYTVTEIEDLVKGSKSGTVALCRCWRSEKFPFCDGSHNKFNESCGDNTGPLLIKKA